MEPIQLNVIDAIRAREQGILRGAQAAERKEPGWNEAAYNALVRYLEGAPDTFMTEDVRASRYAEGLPAPPNYRAWGHIMRLAQKNGLIESAGVAQAKAVTSHRGWANLWRRKLP